MFYDEVANPGIKTTRFANKSMDFRELFYRSAYLYNLFEGLGQTTRY
jgi:hypothetical protein